MIESNLVGPLITPKRKLNKPELLIDENEERSNIETSLATQKSKKEESWLDIFSPSKNDEKEQGFFKGLLPFMDSDDKEKSFLQRFSPFTKKDESEESSPLFVKEDKVKRKVSVIYS